MNELNMNMQIKYNASRWACSLLATFFLALCLPFCLPSNSVLAQDEPAVEPSQQSAAETGDPAKEQQAALEKLIERQATVQKLLPKMLATTVCLTNGQGSGSGVIIDEGGLILTAAHVVEGNKTMTVKFADGRNLTCKVLGIYKPADAAMAQIIEEDEYEFSTAAPEGSLKVGQTVLATGHPSGFDDQRGIPLRMGHIISFKPDFYTADTALIGGDSGGPAFNLAGEVIGIHSNISGDMSVNNDVHIDAFWQNWDQMKSGTTVGQELFQPADGAANSAAPKPLVFGAQLFNSLADEPIRVKSVAENSPASWAGLKANDVILAVNGDHPKTSSVLMRNLKREELGRELTLKIRRGDQELMLDVKLLTGEELKAERARRRGDASEEKDSEEKSTKEADKKKDTESKTSETSTSNLGVAGFTKIQVSRKNRRQAIPTTVKQIAEAEETKSENTQDDETDEKSDLQKLFDQSRKNSGRLKIDRDRLKKYRDQLAKRIGKLGVTGGRKQDTWGNDFQKAFAGTTATISQSTFPVIIGGRHLASALLVESRGYLVTKASEVEGRKVVIRLNTDVDIDATIVQIERDLDLAVLKIDLAAAPLSLTHVDLADHAARGAEPAQGTICGAVNHLADKIAGFGVVSVASRALDGNTSAFLGAESADADTTGALLIALQSEGPANRAGLKICDVIESIDNQVVINSEELVNIIQSRLPHEDTKFNIRRGDRWLTLPVRLGDKAKVAPMPGAREQANDGASTGMSRRRWNFAQGIQHDCAIHPKDCGCALVDLEGHVIGVNIARAGRIKSYAIPVKLVNDFVESAITSDLSEDSVQGGDNE